MTDKLLSPKGCNTVISPSGTDDSETVGPLWYELEPRGSKCRGPNIIPGWITHGTDPSFHLRPPVLLNVWVDIWGLTFVVTSELF